MTFLCGLDTPFPELGEKASSFLLLDGHNKNVTMREFLLHTLCIVMIQYLAMSRDAHIQGTRSTSSPILDSGGEHGDHGRSILDAQLASHLGLTHEGARSLWVVPRQPLVESPVVCDLVVGCALLRPEVAFHRAGLRSIKSRLISFCVKYYQIYNPNYDFTKFRLFILTLICIIEFDNQKNASLNQYNSYCQNQNL